MCIDNGECVVLVSEALMYAQYHRDSASKGSIVKAMASFYAREKTHPYLTVRVPAITLRPSTCSITT